MSDPLVSSLNGFIDEDPVDVEIQRPTKTDDGAGGVLSGTTTSIAKQRVRLVRESSTVTRSGFTGASNETVLDKYVVVGHDNLDIVTDDHFDAKGRRWRVKEVWDGPYRSRRAEVIPLDYDV